MNGVEKIEALQELLTEDNSKIESLGFLLQLAEPTMNGETREDVSKLARIMYDIGGVIRDYTDRISSALSDILYEAEQMEKAG